MNENQQHSMHNDESFFSNYWSAFVGGGVGILLFVVIFAIGSANNKERHERLVAELASKAAEAQRNADREAEQEEERRRNPNRSASSNQKPRTSQSSGYYISPDRTDKYLGTAAQAEMRDFLREHGSPNPSQQDIDFALRLNERLEYHTDRAKEHPELYR